MWYGSGPEYVQHCADGGARRSALIFQYRALGEILIRFIFFLRQPGQPQEVVIACVLALVLYRFGKLLFRVGVTMVEVLADASP